MKISSKGRYGLRAMADLAMNSVNDHVALKHIAERQKISESYLEQVFSILKKAGLVSSIKGSQGGYTLSQNKSNITVGQILRALEGDLSVCETKKNMINEDNKLELCIKSNVWELIDDSVNSTVDRITLKDIVDEYKSSIAIGSIMYHI